MTALGRRALAEFLGTAFLVAAVIGSGIAAVRLSPHDVGLQLLENSVVTGGALVALILALQPVSAAFNPVVTVVERALGMIGTRDAVVLSVAQVCGGVLGAVVANLMFGLSAVTLSTHHRTGAGSWRGEVVATLGLLIVIFGHPDRPLGAGGDRGRRLHPRRLLVHQLHLVRQPGGHVRPDVLRHLRRHRAGLGVGPFILARLVGGARGYLVIRALYPEAAGHRVAPATTGALS